MGFWEITWQNMTYQQECKSKFVQEMEHLREFLTTHHYVISNFSQEGILTVLSSAVWRHVVW
jgi:hypothetical protein